MYAKIHKNELSREFYKELWKLKISSKHFLGAALKLSTLISKKLAREMARTLRALYGLLMSHPKLYRNLGEGRYEEVNTYHHYKHEYTLMK